MPRKPPKSFRIPARVLAALSSSVWAIREDVLGRMVEIARRGEVPAEALAEEPTRYEGDTTQAVVRDGVAILPFIGPGFRYSSWMIDMCGGVSYERTALAFRAALDDPAVKAIVFEVNSPGGEVTGCVDLARMVHAARGKKPIVAYVDGQACSAAYWLSSACDFVTISPTAVVGCLGCAGVATDTSKADEMAGIRQYEIVSSQTPRKRPDVTTEDGRSQLQREIDALAEVFLLDVAAFRGVSPDRVAKDFGAGDVFVGQAAIDRGMADEIGTLEELIAELGDKPGEDGAEPGLSDAPTPGTPITTNAKKARRRAASRGSNMAVNKLRTRLQKGKLSARRRASEEEQKPASKGRRAKAEDQVDEEAEDEEEQTTRRRSRRSRRAEGDQVDEEAEGDDEENGAEGDDDETDAEGDEEDVDAEGDDDEHAEGDEDDADAEGDDDETDAEGDDEPAKTRKGRRSRKASGQDRIRQILRNPAAAGREALADLLAFETGFSVAKAARFLKAAPKASAKGASGSGFRDRMRAENPSAAIGGRAVGDEDVVKAATALGKRYGFTA